MKRQILSSLCCALSLAVGMSTWSVNTCQAETCVNDDANGATICVDWDQGDPELDQDFEVNFTDDDNPDVELLEGSTTWRVWSVQQPNQGVGNIGELKAVAGADFGVEIMQPGGGLGATFVKKIFLVPADPAKGSAITGGEILILTGDLEVQENSAQTFGGTANGFTILGDATGNITLRHGAGFTIGGKFGQAGAPLEFLSVHDIVDGDLTIGTIEGAVIDVADKISNGRLQIAQDALSSNNITIGRMENGSSLRIGYAKPPGSSSVDATIWLQDDHLPADCTLDLGNAVVDGAFVFGVGDKDVGGEILTYSFTGLVWARDITATGKLSVTTDYSSSPNDSIHLTRNLLGSVDIGGELDGNILVDGLCSGQIEIGDGTAASSSIQIGGGLGSTGSIAINANGGNNNADGDIIIGTGSPSLPVTFDGSITIVNCPGSAGGDLGGTITVTGCPTSDPVDICIGGTGNDLQFNQSGCSPAPDWSCVSGQIGYCSCSVNDNCDDGDNVCTFDQCNSSLCSIIPARYCDATGPLGVCGPDGTIDLLDMIAVSNAFGGQYASGCAMHNFDVAKALSDPNDPATGCGADGIIDLKELIAVQKAFMGIDPCGCDGSLAASSQAPAPPCTAGNPIIILDPTPVYDLRSEPPVAYLVDVHLYAFDTLRGYQVGIEAVGPNAEHIQLTSITVEDTKPTYVFAATPSDKRLDAFDLANWRMAGSLHKGGVSVRSYLATYRFEPAPGASSSFSVTIQTTPETAVYDPNGCGGGPQIYDVQLDF